MMNAEASEVFNVGREIGDMMRHHVPDFPPLQRGEGGISEALSSCTMITDVFIGIRNRDSSLRSE